MHAVNLRSLWNTMKEHTRWWLRGRDAVDAITATLLVLSVAAAIGAYLLHRQHEQMTAELEQWRTRPLPQVALPESVKTQRDLEHFVGSLPERKDLSEIISRIFEIAGENNVDLQRADYRLVEDAAAKVIRYQIKYPIKGEPLDIHRFALETLNALPYLGLESLSFRRERSDAVQVDAQIGFVVYVAPRSPSPAASSATRPATPPEAPRSRP